MKERLTGDDIFEHLPLQELIFTRDEALEVLHNYTIGSARFNFDVLTNYAHQLPFPWPARVRREVTPEYIEEQIARLPVGVLLFYRVILIPYMIVFQVNLLIDYCAIILRIEFLRYSSNRLMVIDNRELLR